MSQPDPVETIIAEALTAAGIGFVRERNGLDFYLPSAGIFIECKQFHSERSAAQLARASNIILVQGIAAAKALALFLRSLRWGEDDARSLASDAFSRFEKTHNGATGRTTYSLDLHPVDVAALRAALAVFGIKFD